MGWQTPYPLAHHCIRPKPTYTPTPVSVPTNLHTPISAIITPLYPWLLIGIHENATRSLSTYTPLFPSPTRLNAPTSAVIHLNTPVSVPG